MRKWLWASLLAGCGMASAVSYAGTWSFTARGSDGTVLRETVTIRQVVRGGKVYLSGYGLGGALRGSTGRFSSVRRESDAVRTYAGALTFSARSASGSGTLREKYPNGRVIVTPFRIVGRR